MEVSEEEQNTEEGEEESEKEVEKIKEAEQAGQQEEEGESERAEAKMGALESAAGENRRQRLANWKQRKAHRAAAKHEGVCERARAGGRREAEKLRD